MLINRLFRIPIPNPKHIFISNVPISCKLLYHAKNISGDRGKKNWKKRSWKCGLDRKKMDDFYESIHWKPFFCRQKIPLESLLAVYSLLSRIYKYIITLFFRLNQSKKNQSLEYPFWTDFCHFFFYSFYNKNFLNDSRDLSRPSDNITVQIFIWISNNFDLKGL